MSGIFSFVTADFNPRPREEGDPLTAASQPVRAISIHALVKRATANVGVG